MHWYIEAMLSGDIGTVSEKQKTYLESIGSSTQAMIRLVNTLLDVSRLEFGTFSIEPISINIKTIAEQIVAELQPIALQKNITLTAIFDNNLLAIPLDQRLCNMILQNLLSNAIKYTQPQGAVSCEIKMVEGNIRIVVADNGYGIPLDAQERVFDKVFRASNVIKKEIEGTGLGLYIVKTIVEKVGGKIWFTSIEDKGTQFFVELPGTGMLPSHPKT
jgi:signal transduction histidine kinase